MSNNISQSSITDKDKQAKILILVFTLLLTAIFIILAVVINPSINNNENNNKHTASRTLSRGSNSIYISNEDEYIYYKFIPSTSGTYKFYSNGGSSSFDPEAILCDSSWNELENNDDGAGNRNFLIEHYLYSGNTYYLGVRIRNGSSSKSLTINVE